jgi:hypothetical protein
MCLGENGGIGLERYRNIYRQTHVQHVIVLLQIMFDNIDRVHMLMNIASLLNNGIQGGVQFAINKE